MYFCYFVIFSPWKRAFFFKWTKWNPRHTRIHCAQFDWNWPSRFWGEDFLKIMSMYFRYFVISYHLPLEINETLHLNKLKPPLPTDAFCQVWLKLAKWFWRKSFKFVNAFSLFRNCLPLETGGVYHWKKFESPSLNDALCQVR